jgi:hypothetical protein
MKGIREVRFVNQTILTKSVCNGFKPITTPNNNRIIKCFDLFSLGKPEASFYFLANF